LERPPRAPNGLKLNDEQIVSSLVVLMTEMLTVQLDDLKKKLK
jgi:hypothetical protein